MKVDVSTSRANLPWSRQNAKKAERERKRDIKSRKKRWLHDQQNSPSLEGNKRRGETSGSDEDDWDDLAKEERMAKKVRRGEISKEDFDAAFGGT